jgi:phage terminase large subunit
MVFTNVLTGNTFSPYGLDDPENTKGIPEATHIWIDEIDKCTKEQFALVNSVLRTANCEYLQFIGSFNPVNLTSWLRLTFFDPIDAYKPNPEFGDDLLIHHSTARDNEYINVDAYIRDLMLIYTGDQNAIDVNIHGKWGQPDNKNPWLYNFKYNEHTKSKIPFFPRYPVYISFDFNNDPFAATAWQFSDAKGGRNSFLHCINEFSGYFKIEDMLSRIKAEYPGSILYVTGDRSGQNEDIGRNQTIYQIIQSTLRLGNKQLNLNTKNLEHSDSRILCNMMMAHYPHLLIDRDKCPNLIAQMQGAKVDIKVNKPSHLLKDRGDNKNDEFDSFRYLLQTYFLEFVQRVYLKVMVKK